MFGLTTEMIQLFLILLLNTWLRPKHNYDPRDELTLYTVILYCFYRQLYRVGLREYFYYTMIPSLFTMVLFLAQIFIVRSKEEPMLHHHWLNVLFNRVGLVISFLIYMKHGHGDLSLCKTRGIFKVGFREFHTK